MKMIQTLKVRDRKFYIVQKMIKTGIGRAERVYCAIEDKYVDEYGHLMQKLNGLQMHASKNIEECIQGVKDMVEVQHLMSTGMDATEAIKVVFNIA